MKIFKSDAALTSVIYFLITRITLFVISYCVIHEFALHGMARGDQFRYYENDLLNVWGNYDTGWYLRIARDWYPDLTAPFPESSLTCYSFFPLYPGLIRLFYFTGIDPFITGILISNICLVISGALLFKLTEKIYNKEIAKWSVIFMYLFPVSFIFSGVFTESLYLLLILGCFHFMINQKWFMAGTAAFFLALCRPIGGFILLSLAYEYFKQTGFSFKKIKPGVLNLLFVPAAILILGLNNALSSGKGFSFSQFYGSGYKLPFRNPFIIIYEWINASFFTLNFLAVFTAVIIIFWILFYRHLTISFHLVMFYSIIIPICYTLASVPRMVLVAFPFFILMSSVAVKYKAQNAFAMVLALWQGYLFVCWCLSFGNVI